MKFIFHKITEIVWLLQDLSASPDEFYSSQIVTSTLFKAIPTEQSHRDTTTSLLLPIWYVPRNQDIV